MTEKQMNMCHVTILDPVKSNYKIDFCTVSFDL